MSVLSTHLLQGIPYRVNKKRVPWVVLGWMLCAVAAASAFCAFALERKEDSMKTQVKVKLQNFDEGLEILCMVFKVSFSVL